MAKIEIDGFTFDTEAIPLHNQIVLLTRAIGHVMRNETASSVVAKLRADTYKAEYGDKELSKEAKAEAQKEIATRVKFDADNAVHAQLKRDEQKAAFDEIMNGELGVRASGPKLSPVEARAMVMARDDVMAIFVARGHQFKLHGERPVIPKGDQAFRTKTGVEKTWNEIVKGYFESKSNELLARAKKAIDAEAKEAAKRAEQANADVLADF
jgi:hypothetical protein